ncbi:sigma-54 dependent transcriptional regulator [Pseudoalteromonas luteoviolacea]|uniref:sigma-54-dependent transcriptional regulator n=1 Tax=Pseudoalteromonas luteoviolacea TaxID=43657 RepID=UPI001F30F28F|nr:sigma-54 dependent transcriptional regulator [Pseudoalteromonas luteoviolacea]MCF6443011.1 sigma-54 dependent transcriptional regulator [Pseudoalteromonas luteoviolacea]
MKTVLIVDDLIDVRLSARIVLERHEIRCLEAEHPATALACLEQEKVDLILLDMNFSQDTTSGQEGLAFLSNLTERNINIPVIVITGWAKIDLAVQAMQNGARDFIEKPWKNKRLIDAVKNVIDKSESTLNIKEQSIFWAFSETSHALLEKAKRIAKTDANILITGENGTGKSMLATFIHQHSPRATKDMISVNMAAIPDNLFESELFGHRKGAFTDAKEHRVGRFTLANNSSLFLDEVGCLPLPLQAKLLRVLECGQYEEVGCSKSKHSNARVISATNANLDELIEEVKFRRDLLFRLNTLVIELLPLRARLDELAEFASQFLTLHSRKYGRDIMTLSGQALNKLKEYHWPGNIRELSHVLERAVIMAPNKTIEVQDIQITQTNKQPMSHVPLMSLEQAEQKLITQAITHFDGNVVKAGEFLGLSKSAIYRRMDKFNIQVTST